MAFGRMTLIYKVNYFYPQQNDKQTMECLLSRCLVSFCWQSIISMIGYHFCWQCSLLTKCHSSKRQFAKCNYPRCHYAKWHPSKFHSAAFHSAECHSVKWQSVMWQSVKRQSVKCHSDKCHSSECHSDVILLPSGIQLSVIC